MPDSKLRAISVVGDVTVDWTIVTPPGLDSKLQLAYLWEQKGSATVSAIPGGAALISSLLVDMGVEKVAAPEIPQGALSDPTFPGVAKTFTSWRTFPQRTGSSEGCWRRGEFLGWVAATESIGRTPDAPTEILVIDDADLGFRSNSAQWPSCLANVGSLDAIILKMATPLGAGPLWDHLVEHAADRLTLYLYLDDLRKEDAAIGQALSWERTASEVDAAVRRRTDLCKAARVVVGLEFDGAVVVEPNGGSTLIYDPQALEGDWAAMHPGGAYGTGSAICAGIAAALSSDTSSDFVKGVETGLRLARTLHRDGLQLPSAGAVRFGIRGPLEPSTEFAIGVLPTEPHWSFLGEHGKGEYRAIAEKVLLRGIQPAESGVPVERMGAWASVDRAEIESIRSIRNIVREYLELSIRQRPLSLAVFGPPGSGKSFAIKQMAGQWASSGLRIEVLEFNVSQFTSEEALASAFQRVRDCAVEGSFPLVFWDEFDSARNGQELGWLAQFLAPMQDGSFLEGSLVRPIGSALFVFAGGTHSTMESFKARASSLPQAKATDFLSRLRGYVDILGPNRVSPADDSFVVRRAFLLRQILARKAPQLGGPGGIAVDPGVANAFLSVDRYVHGARSIESIVDMSALTGRSRYSRSSLPAAHQLSLHVDSGEFLRLLDAV